MDSRLNKPAAILAIIVALVLGVVVASAFLGYWRSAAQTREQAALVLQDAVWAETRGEQRRLNRWLAWARLRRREKEVGR